MTTKLFISYSWTDTNHEEWVLDLAKDLRDNGVDVILDKWDLREGQDTTVFMEKMVYDEEISKVILIFDKVYVQKTNKRKGGVGTEAQIISKEIYENTDQNKFVAIIKERDENGDPYTPIYYKSRIYIDLSDDSLYASNFEKLLRWIYDKPLNIKPELGEAPFFATEFDKNSPTNSILFNKALKAIRDNQGSAIPLTEEYFDYVIDEVENLRIESFEGEFDDAVIDSIDSFIPFRNEIIEIVQNLARYHDDSESQTIIHRFFENLIKYLKFPKTTTSVRTDVIDNYKFIIHELFLYTICILIKEECFDAASYLMRTGYYDKDTEFREENMKGFNIFVDHLYSLNSRNKRLNLSRLSLHSDLLKKRCKSNKIDFQDLMQADFVLFIRDHLDNNSADYWYWWPYTLIYANNKTFEIFARSESSKYFESVKVLLDIEDKSELENLLQKFRKERIIPSWQHYSFNPQLLSGFSKIATKV